MTSTGDGTDGEASDTTSRRERVMSVLFGDRLGLVVFLGTLACLTLWWRVGFFLTDSTTVANTLANVADGRLAVVETPYSLTLGSQPGLHRVGDQFFGRNYGHALLATPLVWVLDGLSAVTDPRLVIVGAWSLVLVALARQVAELTERRWIATVSSGVAFALFVGNVVTATSLTEGQTPWAAASTALSGAPTELIALQTTTMVAAAVVAMTTYRLVALFHGRRVGTAAGFGVVLATPLGFWASIPKRHTLTAAAAVVVLYCFAVGRYEERRHGYWTRAGAYATLGLLTTIHPFEALFLFLVLLPLDLLTAPSNDRRTLAVAGIVFLISLVPFLVVNTLISGNPLRPPRMLPGVGANVELSPSPESDTSGAAGGDTGQSGGGTPDSATDGADGGDRTTSDQSESAEGGGNGGDGETTDSKAERSDDVATADGDPSGGDGNDRLPFEFLVAPLLRGLGYADRIFGFAVDSVVAGLAALTEPGRLYHTFVRSGQIPVVNYELNDYETVELAFLETFPLVTAFAWLPAAGVQRLRNDIGRSRFGHPTRQTDLLATGFAIAFTVVYLPRFPVRSQITLRYIVPVLPLILYGLFRLPVVRRPVESVPRWLTGSYLATVLAGSAAVVGALAALDLAVGEAVQFHGLVGLTTAALAAVSVLTWRGHGSDRLLAVGLAVPAGMTTVFLTLSSWVYFDHGRYALDLVRVFTGVLPVL